jgi:peptide/nickel transport system substrate-binding protein
VGRVSSVTPLTARTRAERTLVGLVFSGLMRPGPDDTIEPDLAESWSVDPTGTTWTFRIRDDARWHDGQPVTAADVVFTARALRSANVGGPAAASWAEVTAAATSSRTVTLTLKTPLGGFMAAATQPLLPAHLLGDVPLAQLASDPFGLSPVGTGPFAITELDAAHAVLEPAALIDRTPTEPTDDPLPTDSLASDRPLATPDRALPYLDRIEIRFYADAGALADAFTAGDIDGFAGLPAAMAQELNSGVGVQLVRYPTTTLSTIALNLRAEHPEFRVAAVRRGLLSAIDRDALIEDALGGGARRADAMVPPSSWAFDATAALPLAYDVAAGKKALADAGWKQAQGGGLAAPGQTEAYAMEILSVPAEVNPATNALAQGVAEAWQALGLIASVVEVPAAELTARLRDGDYSAAVVDIAFGLEPDLYPMLATSQVIAPGDNVSGLQDALLDSLLVTARAPGTPEARKAAWTALLAGVDARMPMLPLAWRDELAVQRGLIGPTPRLLADPGDRFWDVLAWRLAADR